MADITEQLLRLPEEIDLPKKGRSVIAEARKTVIGLRETVKESEAEIVRLREGLRRVRYDFTDIGSAAAYAEKLLNIKASKEL